VRRDEQDRVIGYWGLTIVPTRHSLSFGARTLYGWCAWDTLFLPALLGERAQVRSVCRASGAPVRLTVAPDSVRAAAPAELFLSFVLPEAGALREDVTTAFCRYVHFHVSTSRPEGHDLPRDAFFLSLEEAFEAGQLRNRGRYRDHAGFERGGRDAT
jgi:alkylmercury lyase